MDIPLVGFVAQVTLFAFPYCWLLRFIEKRVVGIRSDFWDGFLVSFIALVGQMIINLILMITIGSMYWIIYDAAWYLFSIVLWFILIRKILICEGSHSLKISITLVSMLYVISWIFTWTGIELSIIL